MNDIYVNNGPATDCFPVTPSDTTLFPQMARGFNVGGAGNVTILTPKGNVVTIFGCLAGKDYAYACIRINATNTTATNLVALV